MLRAIAFRLASLLLTLFIISVAIFVILEVLPGDPAAIMLGTSSQPDTLAALRHRGNRWITTCVGLFTRCGLRAIRDPRLNS